jgi:hypothetical protein
VTFFDGKAYLNGSGAARKAGIDFRYSDFFPIAPGDNEIEVSGATVLVKTNPAWADGLYCYDNYGQAILVGGSYQDSRTAGQPGYSIDIQLWNCTFTHNSVDPNQSLTGSEVNRTQAALNIAQRHGHSIYYGNNADSTNGEQGSLDGVVANCVFHDQSEGFSMRIGDCARGLIITNNTVDTSTSPASTVSDELVAHGFPPADGHFWGIAISLSNGTNIGTYCRRCGASSSPRSTARRCRCSTTARRAAASSSR